MRIGMFSQGHSRREVKAALNDHYRRDSTVLGILDTILAACVVGFVRHFPIETAIEIAGGVFATVFGLRYFIDQSNRNFYLHRLDWEASPPDKPLG